MGKVFHFYFFVVLIGWITWNGNEIRVSRPGFICAFVYISVRRNEDHYDFKPSASPCSLQDRNHYCVCFLFLLESIDCWRTRGYPWLDYKLPRGVAVCDLKKKKREQSCSWWMAHKSIPGHCQLGHPGEGVWCWKTRNP